ncbi:hypothetical protein SASPL_123842 [Salvia splendens]|uniref:AP180 N-terminal homology (ANTH) domain-containing protein n=1 Tax=Salvia splendens TaxID=180675 RepID=A0A8X8ZTD6_SALSN|nr:hypothetical protein SASPL_123842 [Salvia splendens]
MMQLRVYIISLPKSNPLLSISTFLSHLFSAQLPPSCGLPRPTASELRKKHHSAKWIFDLVEMEKLSDYTWKEAYNVVEQADGRAEQINGMDSRQFLAASRIYGAISGGNRRCRLKEFWGVKKNSWRTVFRESDGSTSLYPCTFHDSTSSASDDYTAFVKSYARLLDEALDAHAFISTNGDDADKLTCTIEVMPQVQSLIDRAIGCWPVGAASRSFLVRSAMKHVIRDTAWKAAMQAEELSRFHDWCKGMGYCGSYEYPYIDRILAIQIRRQAAVKMKRWSH